MPSQLIDLEIPRPGIFGVNTSLSSDVMPKEYAVQLENIVMSTTGFIEARRGSRRRHASTLQAILDASTVVPVGSTQTVRQIFDTVDENGDDLTIFTTEEGIYKIVATTVTVLSESMTIPTAGNWKFANLNDNIIGFQAGHRACIMTTPSTGGFVNVTFTGTEAPVNTTSSIVADSIAAFGRIWILEGLELKYSSVLAPTDFDPTGGDAGAFTLASVFLNGRDVPRALAEFNGNLLVFSDNHVVIYGNPWNPNDSGSNYGGTVPASAVEQAPMKVVDTITGVGCIARDSIQYTQNDILFLSEQGITSLARVVQEKSMPISRYSDNIQDDILKMIRSNDMDTVFSTYLPARGSYLIGSSTGSVTFNIDTSAPLPDGSYRVTTWNKTIYTLGRFPQSRLTSSEDEWASVFIADEADYISRCEGYKDNVEAGGGGGVSYLLVYESSWTAIVDELKNHIKIPKSIQATVRGDGTQLFNVNIAYDYSAFASSKSQTFTFTLAEPSVYLTHTYGGTTEDSTTAYYGIDTGTKESKKYASGQGRIIKLRFYTTINGSAVALQHISVNAKIGRKH